METQDSVNDREWNNPSNWRQGRYSSASDTRLWVPKRAGIGQALNIAHPGAKVFLAGMSIIPLGLLLVVIVYALTQ
jgi:uncharacterized membrane protein